MALWKWDAESKRPWPVGKRGPYLPPWLAQRGGDCETRFLWGFCNMMEGRQGGGCMHQAMLLWFLHVKWRTGPWNKSPWFRLKGFYCNTDLSQLMIWPLVLKLPYCTGAGKKPSMFPSSTYHLTQSWGLKQQFMELFCSFTVHFVLEAYVFLQVLKADFWGWELYCSNAWHCHSLHCSHAHQCCSCPFPSPGWTRAWDWVVPSSLQISGVHLICWSEEGGRGR